MFEAERSSQSPRLESVEALASITIRGINHPHGVSY